MFFSLFAFISGLIVMCAASTLKVISNLTFHCVSFVNSLSTTVSDFNIGSFCHHSVSNLSQIGIRKKLIQTMLWEDCTYDLWRNKLKWNWKSKTISYGHSQMNFTQGGSILFFIKIVHLLYIKTRIEPTIALNFVNSCSPDNIFCALEVTILIEQ